MLWAALMLVIAQFLVVLVLHRVVKTFGQFAQQVLDAHKSNLILYHDNHAVLRELVRWRQVTQSTAIDREDPAA